MQDFLVTLRCADNQHAHLKAALDSGLASSPFIKKEMEQTVFGDAAMVGGVVVAVTATNVKVLAPIELMMALLRAMPYLSINTMTAPLEL